MKAALKQIPEEIRRLIAQHQQDLEEAWAVKEADESLLISFSAKIGLDKKGNNVCEISISFVKDRIKDGTVFFWDDRQLPLLKEVEKIDAKLKRDGLSMTITSPGHEAVTLGKKDELPESELPEDTNEFYTKVEKILND